MNRKYSSSQLKEKRRRKKIIRRWFIGIGILIFLALISYVSHLPKLSVESVVISENSFVNDSETIDRINGVLDGRHLFLFSKRNFLLIPRSKIKEIVTEDIAVKNVDINLNGLKQISVEIEEYEGVLKWCGNSYLNPGSCYLINNLGVVFANDIFVDVPVIYGIFENEENIIGKEIMELGDFVNLTSFATNLTELNIHVDYIDTEDGETFAIHTTESPYILITNYISSEDLLNNLNTVIETEEINEAQFDNIEYIDLRFDNRVFYQLR